MSSTAGTDPLIREVRKCLVAAGIGPGAAVVAACSGGPDSTALLHALSALSPIAGFRVVCAYLDHGMRGEAERLEEASAVVALADRCGVRLVRSALAAGALYADSVKLGASVEEMARERRYRFLLDTAMACGAAHVALGHTTDDVAETILMRALQGVDVSGLRGIPERRGVFIRPLYHIGRREVMDYLQRNRLTFVVDSTNAELRYLRNHVRAEVIPAVARVFPSYRRSLLELGRKARETHRYILETARASVPWERAGDGVRTPWSSFLAADAVLRVAAAYEALDLLGARRIPYRFLEPLGGPIVPHKHGTVLAGCGFRFVRHGPSLHVVPDIVRRRGIGYLLCIPAPGKYAIPECGIVATVESPPQAVGAGSSGAGYPAVLRSRRPGDRVRWRGRWVSLDRSVAGHRGGEPLWDRVPIVADRFGVAAVLAAALGGSDIVADDVGEKARVLPAISVKVTVEDE